MKSLIPWMCIAVAVSQQALAEDSFSAYRLGKYNAAAQPLYIQTGKDAVADYYLGRLYLYGYGQQKNTNLAVRYFTKSAEKGYLPAELIMAKYSLFALNNPEQAVRWFKMAADAGNVQAQMFMAAAYLYGIGVKPNPDVATKFYIDAAKNGNPIAQYALAENFIDSRHASNGKLGLIWLTKSAAAGNPKAITKLADIYLHGKLTDKDIAKATELLNQAIAKNYLPALVVMGDVALEQGKHQDAINWYTKAANQGNVEAYLHLAHAYLQDKSPIYNANNGYLWTLKAAQNGSTDAKNELASLYTKGLGIEKNDAMAKQWSDIAAKEAKQRSKTPALAQAALWLTNGLTDKLDQTDYQMGGILSVWQNATALRNNTYNQGPQIAIATRKSIFKPQFELIQPNEVPISSIYDALNRKHSAFEENQWTYPTYPLNPQMESLNKLYSMATTKEITPAPYMDANYYDYSDFSQASLMDLWTEGWQKHANYNAVFSQLYFRAILGDADSQFQIGQMFQYGLGVAPSDASATIFYQNAAEQQHLGAEYNLGILLLQHAQDEQGYQQALSSLTDSAFKGNRNAQYVLARVLEQGKTGSDGKVYISPNHEQAISMLYLAAANNYGPAQYDLADTLSRQSDSGLNVEVTKRRIAMIRQLYQGAADNGVVQALLPLAYYNAMDSDKLKQSSAFNVAFAQANKGDENAALLLGLLYDRGIGVAADQAKAINWYEHSGKNSVSEFILGTYTAEGKGISADKDAGMEDLRNASKGKFSYADFNLAVLKEESGRDFLPNLINAYTLGNSHAGIVLADYYLSANTDAEKINQAKTIYTGLAEKGDQYAQLKLGFMLDKGLGSNPDPLAAQRWYTASALQGNAQAQYVLGQYYQEGRNGSPDYALAKEWYQKSATQLSKASVALGFIYDTVDDNYPLALKSYETAADKGDTEGLYDLALMYFYGKGVPVNYDKAKQLLTQAADKGFTYAMTQLGSMSINGLGQQKDDREALTWYQKAAEAGDANALYEMGALAENGMGSKPDLTEAVKYYQASADKGNDRGMLALARMYQHGTGVTQDIRRSFDLYQKLADRQNADAQYQLGTLYLEGIGGERSPDKAKQLLHQASDNGSVQAQQALEKLDPRAPGNISSVDAKKITQAPVVAGKATGSPTSAKPPL